MKDCSHFARMVDPTHSSGSWKHAPIKRAQTRSIGPVFVCLIGVIVAVFGLTLISG